MPVRAPSSYSVLADYEGQVPTLLPPGEKGFRQRADRG